MSHWLFAEPVGDSSETVWMIYSEEAILAEHWESWKRQGEAWNLDRFLDPSTGITKARCIQDWTVTHWAVPATPENLLKIISAPKGK